MHKMFGSGSAGSAQRHPGDCVTRAKGRKEDWRRERGSLYPDPKVLWQIAAAENSHSLSCWPRCLFRCFFSLWSWWHCMLGCCATMSAKRFLKISSFHYV